jgi:hypothetical protein
MLFLRRQCTVNSSFRIASRRPSWTSAMASSSEDFASRGQVAEPGESLQPGQIRD